MTDALEDAERGRKTDRASLDALQNTVEQLNETIKVYKRTQRVLEQQKDDLERKQRILQAENEAQAEKIETLVEEEVRVGRGGIRCR